MPSSNNLLSSIKIDPPRPPIGTVIWLHGLGANGNDFAPIVPQLHLPPEVPLRFIFPNAPLKPVTINNGYVMPAWYDITSMGIDQKIDREGILASIQQLEKLIEHEESVGIPRDKIVLAGFSQGAVIALTAGLRSPRPVAGVLALSGYLPFSSEMIANAVFSHRALPIFLAHGTQDEIIPYRIGQAAYDFLKKQHFSAATWHSYPMAHSVCDQQINDIAIWLGELFM